MLSRRLLGCLLAVCIQMHPLFADILQLEQSCASTSSQSDRHGYTSRYGTSTKAALL